MRKLSALYGKYMLKSNEIRLNYKGNLDKAFIDDGKSKKSKKLNDDDTLKSGILGIMFLSDKERVWEVPKEKKIYNEKDDTVLLKSMDTILEIKVDILRKYFKKVKEDE